MIDSEVTFHWQTQPRAVQSYVGDLHLALEEANNITAERAGEPLEIVMQITEDFASAGGTSTLQIVVLNATLAELEAGVGGQLMFDTGAVAEADLVAGKKYYAQLSLPIDNPTGDHIGVQIATAVEAPTAGEFSAWVQRAGTDQVTIND